ncbi:hypothetical protein AL190_002200 [Vibrio parahaemolyticus]|uniref:hypothetical protein n=1 Tax=Vibrio parahaemolyticus TaxID=670 RepID=UPI00084B72C7|nr:hypothetical protein [Vibrio parahaemolyticus]EHH1183075.1 hypothetical protein [Vibrio vulnificus]EIV8647407.1 hypothetical protein [Vibrio parahaemolyticus]EJE4733601.1 hypothetical protein [Vibrio parahaemolyticus]ODZ36580.1 hypothetical protein BBN02_12760 [Vibrio parahaemolyticus]
MKVLKMYSTSKGRHNLVRESESTYELFNSRYKEYFGGEWCRDYFSKALIRLFVNDRITSDEFKEFNQYGQKMSDLLDEMGAELPNVRPILLEIGKKSVDKETDLSNIKRFIVWHQKFKGIHRRIADLCILINDVEKRLNRFNIQNGYSQNFTDAGTIPETLLTIEQVAFLVELGWFTKASIKKVLGITDYEMRKASDISRQRVATV